MRTARADYEDPTSLRAAFAGADSLVLVSSRSDHGRAAQHANAVGAAAAAGVGLVAYTDQIPLYLSHGITGAAGEGRISAATRADLAAAAAAVVSTEGHAGATYELGGDAFTLVELAEVLSRESGTAITYTDVSQEAYAEILRGVGMPAPMAAEVADAEAGAAAGGLYVPGEDLATLLGRRPTPLVDAVRAALASSAS